MGGIDSQLPPARDPTALQMELRLCPSRDRADALQEAWLASIEGRSPARAVNTYAQRERRHRRSEIPFGTESW